jgi:hypothetical protein
MFLVVHRNPLIGPYPNVHTGRSEHWWHRRLDTELQMSNSGKSATGDLTMNASESGTAKCACFGRKKDEQDMGEE